mmetsp:Transcript_16503/g.46542  ORF Transcript_16503/g.46542 Transcript_16503/m.46542 type:complete len:209 (-) Transcript_16503:53-679(-)
MEGRGRSVLLRLEERRPPRGPAAGGQPAGHQLLLLLAAALGALTDAARGARRGGGARPLGGPGDPQAPVQFCHPHSLRVVPEGRGARRHQVHAEAGGQRQHGPRPAWRQAALARGSPAGAAGAARGAGETHRHGRGRAVLREPRARHRPGVRHRVRRAAPGAGPGGAVTQDLEPKRRHHNTSPEEGDLGEARRSPDTRHRIGFFIFPF